MIERDGLRGLQDALELAFHPPAVAGVDAVFRLAIGEEVLLLQIRDGMLNVETSADARPDVTFLFRDIDAARALLSGHADPFEAFLQGDFRADGHLMWAFTLLAMFRSRGSSASG